MADANQIVVPENLKQRFSEFGRIAEITRRLKDNIDHINTLNVTAAGTDDATAKAYHEQIDGPTKDLSTLVGDIATLFDLTGDNGAAAADQLSQAAADALDVATGWVPKK